MYFHDGWWFGFWGHVVPLLVFLLLIGLVVWAVLRISGRQFGPALATAGMAPALHRDPALSEVRLRYARGDMNREEFIQRWRDLGGQPEPTRTSGLSVTEVQEPGAEAGEPPAPEGG
jgi:putative membrane protein